MAGTGQSIFDTLSAAAGHPINRAGLNLQLAQAQSMGAYRDAETQDAMERARMSRDQAQAFEEHQTAIDHLSSSMTPMIGDPDMARGMAEAIMKDGPVGLLNFNKAMTSEQQEHVHQQYINAAATDKPAILAMGVDAGMPWATSFVQEQQKTAQAAAALKETNARIGLIGAQTQGALATAHAKSLAANGQLSDASLDMGAYFLTHFGILPPTIGGFGMAGAKQQIQNHITALEAQGSPIVNRSIANPEWDSIYQLGQQSVANQHGLNTQATQVAGGKLGQSINAITTTTQHLELLRQAIGQMNNGDIKPLNALAASFGINTGQAAPVVAQMTAETVGAEYANIYAPGNSTQAQRDMEAKTFGVKVLSPGQAESVINQAQGFMQGKQAGNEEQYIGAAMPAFMQANPGMDPAAASAALSQQFRTQVVNNPAAQRLLYGSNRLENTQPATLPGETSAQPSPPGGVAPTLPAVSTGAGASPPRLTQTPPGTPGGTPAGATPGVQSAPPTGAPNASGGPSFGAVSPVPAATQPATVLHPTGHQAFPTVGPHGFAPDPSQLKQATDPNDPGLNHMPNGELWSWRAGDVPRYVGNQAISPSPNATAGGPVNGTTQQQ